MLDELIYPFDAEKIISAKKILRRKLFSECTDRIKKKVAILGGYTTNDVRLVLELFLLNYGIEPIFYESSYNQYYQDAMFTCEKLASFSPDVIYICTSNRNITTYPNLSDTVEEINAMLNLETDRFKDMWDRLSDIYDCPIIQNNFEMPLYRLMGNRDAYDVHGRVNYINRLNNAFYEYAQTHENFFICDINFISADYGLKEWSNPFYWYNYKYALNVKAIPYLSYNVANIIKSIFGKNKKGFVLDLDNTLWGGIIGDDGIDGIEIGPEESTGQLYLEFQEYVKAHKDLGIILNVDSKNDEVNALAGLNHPDSLLRPDDFVSIKANWSPKDRNLASIADELDLLPESLLFIDDNPAEREIVRNIDGVIAPELGENHRYIQNIDRGGYFETTYVSADDAKRNEMYKENANRKRQANGFTDYHEYLLSLEMVGIIEPFKPIYYSRIAQLSNKSNQFNLTTRRYTESEIARIAGDGNYITLYGKLIDKFGDNGVVSVVIGKIDKDVLHIDLWIMSCRVLKRDMEYAMMDELIDVCKVRNINHIMGYYYPTVKNSMVMDFYKLQGFRLVSEDNSGNTTWEINVMSDNKLRTDVIRRERE